jgi:hypothetical protein
VFLVERPEVHFGEPETTSLKEENGRRPIFFIFWPNEVPKKISWGFLDVLNPLAVFSQPFENFFCRFLTIEVSESSRELEALIV